MVVGCSRKDRSIIVQVRDLHTHFDDVEEAGGWLWGLIKFGLVPVGFYFLNPSSLFSIINI